MDALRLIDCWEHGRRRHPLDRALLLFAAAAPGEDPETLADRTLGERNAALLRLRQKMFGDALKSCVECPECGEQLEFALSANTLLEPSPPGVARAAYVDIQGVRVRLPTTRDLASVATEGDPLVAEARLFERLIGAASAAAPSPEDLTRELDAADPCMDLALDLTCPACAHAWSAAFDVPAFLWEEVEVRARRLLDEVHALARSYGWAEREILALSEVRRNAYLERVLA